MHVMDGLIVKLPARDPDAIIRNECWELTISYAVNRERLPFPVPRDRVEEDWAHMDHHVVLNTPMTPHQWEVLCLWATTIHYPRVVMMYVNVSRNNKVEEVYVWEPR